MANEVKLERVWTTPLRRRVVLHLYASGFPIDDIAEAMHMCQDKVLAILREKRERQQGQPKPKTSHTLG